MRLPAAVRLVPARELQTGQRGIIGLLGPQYSDQQKPQGQQGTNRTAHRSQSTALNRAYHFAVCKSHAASIPAIPAGIALPLRPEEIGTEEVVKHPINA